MLASCLFVFDLGLLAANKTILRANYKVYRARHAKYRGGGGLGGSQKKGLKIVWIFLNLIFFQSEQGLFR